MGILFSVKVMYTFHCFHGNHSSLSR